MPGPAPDTAPLFAEPSHGTLRLVAYLALAGVVMVADHRGHYLDGVRQAAARLTGPLYSVIGAPARMADAARAAVTDRSELAQDNAAMREQLLLAQARLARLSAVQDQNTRLRELLDARTRLGLKAQLAELMEVDLDPFRHRILLDGGAEDGIRPGQAVMDARGVMGQIIDVQPARSVLILITDPGHAIPVRVVRTGLRTIAYGTGELVNDAVEAGARRVIVGVGGSATTDGGLGALRALYPLQRLRGVEIVVACDVSIGFVDAAERFAPQKGASPAQVELLRRRLERLAQVYEEEHGVDVRALRGSGAAGGLAGGLAAAGATLVDGFEVVAEEVGLDEKLEGADLVVTGEGFLDEASFEGKVVGGVASLAAEVGVPVLAVVGQVYDGVDDRVPVVSLVERFGQERAVSDTTACVTEAVAAHLATLG